MFFARERSHASVILIRKYHIQNHFKLERGKCKRNSNNRKLQTLFLWTPLMTVQGLNSFRMFLFGCVSLARDRERKVHEIIKRINVIEVTDTHHSK